MLKALFEMLLSPLLAVDGTVADAPPRLPADRELKAETGFVAVRGDLLLRRMVLRNREAKGTVLLLHGFPETLAAWEEIAPELGRDYEVHAFDWPGYGLSSRPARDRFSYSPKAYARVLRSYIMATGIDRSRLTIYATDIGALPALLLALDEPDIARRIIVGDFAPFDRPEHMYESLRNLKSASTSERTRQALNANRADILDNGFGRGLGAEARFELPPAVRADIGRGWNRGGLTSADAFHHYYARFTRDQDYFEANADRLKTPVKIVWGEEDIFIRKEMGIELAQRLNADLAVLPGVGHYPHLQAPDRTVEEIRASFR
jgi:pimeloyl-ACP methyl ester carboxylesterase